MRHPVRLLVACAALTLLAGPALAQYPCSFAWNALKATNGYTYNYTTPAVAQPYQGPCMAFAMVSAMESMYELEHNSPNSTPNLSEAWIDYLTWGSTDFKLYLETQGNGVPKQACGNFAPNCTDEVWQCKLNGTVKPITQAGDCFSITREYNETIHEWEYLVNSQSPSGMGWYYAGNVDDNLSISNANALKGHLLNGPVVLKVDGSSNITKFRSYNASGISYHAFTVIGWKDIGSCTQWLVKDSWPGMAGFAYTKADPGIAGMVSSGDVQAYQVSDISYQSTTGGSISPPGSSWPAYNASNQCVPPPGVNGSLNCWDFGADKGGCMNLSGAMKGYTVSWQLSGSNGSLYNTTGQCAEIIGSNFTGTLTATATDGCGRTSTKSCSFTAPPGPGGGGFGW